MHQSLRIDPDTLAQFCRAHHICKLSLFGSRLKGVARDDSDVDLLVKFDEGHVPSLFAMTRMEAELSELMGQRVDLRTEGDLSRYFRHSVLGEAEVQYAA